MLERDGELSERRQCRLLGISRSSLDYTPKGESPENLALMRRLDELSLQYPFYGSRQMRRHLRREGAQVGRHRIRRLMRLLGLKTIYPKPRTSTARSEHRVYPYLLRGLKIDEPHQVWCADITYNPGLQRVFVPGGGDGLGQSVRTVVAVVQHPGQRVLCRGFGKGALPTQPSSG